MIARGDGHVRAATRRGVFASLRTRNYRLYFFGQLVSQSGNWMQTVALSFLVLQLTDSGTQLGLATAARYLPIFLAGPWGGLVADRFNKRRVLAFTQTTACLLALLLCLLTAVGAIRMWEVYTLTAASGTVNVFDIPARQSLIVELVTRSDMSNAVTLNSITVNTARLSGAALGGVVASTLGFAVSFGINAASFLAVLIALLLMDGSLIHAAPRAAREGGQVRSGFRYVRRTPELLIPLIMIGVVGALAWEFQITLPLIAKFAFGGGAGLYGAMVAVMSAGAIAGGLITAARPQPRTRSLAVSAIGWGIALTAAALAPSPLAEWIALVFVGYGSIAFNSVGRTILQLASAPDMRGRVMALWMVAWAGTTPIGGPIVGWFGQEFGARYSLLAGGLPTLAAGLVAYPVLAAIEARRQAATADEAAAARGPAIDEQEPGPSINFI